MDIRHQVESLQYKGDTVTLNNVFPSMLEDIFDFSDGICVESAGRTLDYGGEAEGYEFSGSAYYGYCHVTKLNGFKRPVKETIIDENKYTRTHFMHKGREVENVPPVVTCSKDVLNELVKNGTLKLFYITFNYSYDKSELIAFYAKDEWDARLRALSIWGYYDDIKTGEYIEELKNTYPRFNNAYYIKDEKYVLDWKEV